MVPNFPDEGKIRYRCIYLSVIRFKFNLGEIFVIIGEKTIVPAVVKLIDNCYAELYIRLTLGGEGLGGYRFSIQIRISILQPERGTVNL